MSEFDIRDRVWVNSNGVTGWGAIIQKRDTNYVVIMAATNMVVEVGQEHLVSENYMPEEYSNLTASLKRQNPFLTTCIRVAFVGSVTCLVVTLLSFLFTQLL